MRRSRLYLTLSIVSMLVAFGLGVAQKHCRYSNCYLKQDRVEVDADMAREPVWDAFHARDFDRMAAEAMLLDSAEDTRLRAYALRGQGRHDEAAEAYSVVLQEPSSLAEQCDCYIGRAFCNQKLGRYDNAREDIDRAKALANSLVRRNANEAHLYQLACAYAVEAAIAKGSGSEEARTMAIGKFQHAIEKGFNSWDHARADIDLDALRGDHRFNELFPQP